MYFKMFFWIVQEAGAEAEPVFVAREDVEVPASFAAFPELGVVRQFVIGNGTESELVVHLHDCSTGGQRENLGIREEFAGEDESLLLDAFGKAQPAELAGDDEAGIGHETLASPGFYIGKARELAFIGQGDDGFSRADLLIDIFRGAVGDTRLPLEGGYVDFLANCLRINSVALLGHHDFEFHFRYLLLSGCKNKKFFSYYANISEKMHIFVPRTDKYTEKMQNNTKQRQQAILDILAKYGIEDNRVTLWGTGKPLREFLWSEDMADASVHVLLNVNFSDIIGIEKYSSVHYGATTDGAVDRNHSKGRGGAIPSLGEIRNCHINVGTGKELTIRELAELVVRTVGFKGELLFDTTKPDGTLRKLIDVSKLQSLGWTYKVEIEDGVRRLFEWYQQSLQ